MENPMVFFIVVGLSFMVLSKKEVDTSAMTIAPCTSSGVDDNERHDATVVFYIVASKTAFGLDSNGRLPIVRATHRRLAAVRRRRSEVTTNQSQLTNKAATVAADMSEDQWFYAEEVVRAAKQFSHRSLLLRRLFAELMPLQDRSGFDKALLGTSVHKILKHDADSERSDLVEVNDTVALDSYVPAPFSFEKLDKLSIACKIFVEGVIEQEVPLSRYFTELHRTHSPFIHGRPGCGKTYFAKAIAAALSIMYQKDCFAFVRAVENIQGLGAVPEEFAIVLDDVEITKARTNEHQGLNQFINNLLWCEEPRTIIVRQVGDRAGLVNLPIHTFTVFTSNAATADEWLAEDEMTLADMAMAKRRIIDIEVKGKLFTEDQRLAQSQDQREQAAAAANRFLNSLNSTVPTSAALLPAESYGDSSIGSQAQQLISIGEADAPLLSQHQNQSSPSMINMTRPTSALVLPTESSGESAVGSTAQALMRTGEAVASQLGPHQNQSLSSTSNVTKPTSAPLLPTESSGESSARSQSPALMRISEADAQPSVPHQNQSSPSIINVTMPASVLVLPTKSSGESPARSQSQALMRIGEADALQFAPHQTQSSSSIINMTSPTSAPVLPTESSGESSAWSESQVLMRMGEADAPKFAPHQNQSSPSTINTARPASGQVFPTESSGESLAGFPAQALIGIGEADATTLGPHQNQSLSSTSNATKPTSAPLFPTESSGESLSGFPAQALIGIGEADATTLGPHQNQSLSSTSNATKPASAPLLPTESSGRSPAGSQAQEFVRVDEADSPQFVAQTKKDIRRRRVPPHLKTSVLVPVLVPQSDPHQRQNWSST